MSKEETFNQWLKTEMPNLRSAMMTENEMFASAFNAGYRAQHLTPVVADSANAPRLHRSEVTEIFECPTCGSILTPNS